MNILDIFGRLLDLAPKVLDVVRRTSRRGAAPRTRIPFGRSHVWSLYVPGSKDPFERLAVPLCVYCEQSKNAVTERSPCPGPSRQSCG